MSTHIAFPSIEQFKNAVRRVTDHATYMGRDGNDDPVYDRSIIPPTLKYQATTKLHGTNFAMGRTKSTGEIWFQSRETIITPEKDNAGAARFFSSKDLNSLFDAIDGDHVIIYGEWCGKGIQSKVAIVELPKMLVVFDAYILDDDKWLSAEKVKEIKSPENQIYNIYDYPTWEIEIDFSKPELSQNRLVEITTEIADCCPVGKAFGVEGIGEGAVWRCITEGYEDPKFRFKVKDERHANGSKPKVLNAVDSEAITRLRELADKVTPVWRLDQMVEKACDLNNGGRIELKQIPIFLKLVSDDIIKEEADFLTTENVKYEDIAKFVSTISRTYFLQREKQL